jgi:uncharacterized SAM-binding protein YcdF (DUF218 family)
MTPGSATAIVVPGNSRRGRITPACERLLAHATELADREAPSVVVFTGWKREAEQMRDAWPGRRDVELVVEPTARTTVENALHTVPLLRERGIAAARVVCTPLHAARVRLIFPRVLGRAGIACRVDVARVRPTPRAFAWELGAFVVLRRQLRRALAELRHVRG